MDDDDDDRDEFDKMCANQQDGEDDALSFKMTAMDLKGGGASALNE